MSTIPDEKFYEHAERVKDRVVLITGAANGIGKMTALQFASYGAKIVIGDRDVAGAQKTVEEIRQAGGEAVSKECNVIVWEDQVALFQLAIKEYGAVDIVVANAGVGESCRFLSVAQDAYGTPVKPNLRTYDVNVLGTSYTAHLAQHYLLLNRKVDLQSLKAIVLIGSMASWQAIPLAPLYSASKHAILGLTRSLRPILEEHNVRVASIHPSFAETGFLKTPVRVLLAGLPIVPVSRVSGTIFYAATDPTPETNGAAWCLMDDGHAFVLPEERLKVGVYKVMDERVRSLIKGTSRVRHYIGVTKDLFKIFPRSLSLFGVGLFVSAVAFGYWARLSRA